MIACSRLTVLATAVVLLSACAGVPKSSTQGEKDQLFENRRAELGSLQGWDLEARIAIRAGEDGGSGRLDWRTLGSASNMKFRGAFGRGSWELDSDARGAVLRTADGHVDSDPSLESLVARNAGWGIPVDALYWWVQGLPAPGSYDLIELDDEGQPARVEQDGWIIVYDRYRALGSSTVPGRMIARSQDRHVKVLVASWSPAVAADSNQHRTGD